MGVLSGLEPASVFGFLTVPSCGGFGRRSVRRFLPVEQGKQLEFIAVLPGAGVKPACARRFVLCKAALQIALKRLIRESYQISMTAARPTGTPSVSRSSSRFAVQSNRACASFSGSVHARTQLDSIKARISGTL